MTVENDLFSLRMATAADAPALTRHRRLMFEEMGRDDSAANSAMDAWMYAHLAGLMESGEYVGWLATDSSGALIGGGGLQRRQVLATPENRTGRSALILNVYVEPPWRRRGVARRLMLAMVDWCHGEGLTDIRLHASEQGRPLYLSLGFTPTNEMRLR
jgi:GNAT superfamily N-acetyltransferase